MQTLVLLLLDIGLRITVALNLARANLDSENLPVHVVSKGNEERFVPMPVELRGALWRHVQRCQLDWIFCTRRGVRLTRHNVLQDFNGLCQRLGLLGVRCSPYTPHQNTLAVDYLRPGGNVFWATAHGR